MDTFQVEIPVPSNLEEQVSEMVLKTTSNILDKLQDRVVSPGWYRREGAALYAGVSESTISEWVKRGLPQHPMSTGVILYSKDDIDNFIKSHL